MPTRYMTVPTEWKTGQAVRIAAAVLSVAVQIAVQLSGLGGTIASLVAWLAVAVSAAVLIYGLVSDKKRLERGPPDLSLVLRDLSRDLGSFTLGRRMSAPRPERRQRPSAWAADYLRGRPGEGFAAAHAQDTMALYEQLYAERVNRVVIRLRTEGCIGIQEAQILVAPVDPASVERIARRLGELGRTSARPGEREHLAANEPRVLAREP